MIQVTELRIGNLVDTVNRCGTVHLPANTPMRVYDIAPFGVSLYYPENNPATMAHIPTYDIRDICGIPITEEVLLKCGAIRLNEKKFPSYNLHGMQINFIHEKWIEYVTRIEITGLHHLQNIFFFTKNQELTYTP